MDDQKKTIAAITLIVVFVCFVALLVGFLVSRKKSIVSPVPEEGAIRIIFVSPTVTPPPASLPSTSPTSTPKPTPKPTIKSTATPTPTKIASPSATPKP
ncbi:MAG: hypothetical protein AAB557_00260 [Patescibacteria group bacterium]